MAISWSRRTVAMLRRALPRCPLTLALVHLETIISGLSASLNTPARSVQTFAFPFTSLWKGWTETYRITWRMFTTNSSFNLFEDMTNFFKKKQTVSVVCGSLCFVCIFKVTVWFICCLSEVQSSTVQLCGRQPSLEKQNHPAFPYKVLHPVLSWNCPIFLWESKIIDTTLA